MSFVSAHRGAGKKSATLSGQLRGSGVDYERGPIDRGRLGLPLSPNRFVDAYSDRLNR
jgi:hypothetical protein